MRITIVKDDNLVIIDREPLTLDLTPFHLPKSFHALQWYGDKGEVEYKEQHLMNAEITAIDDFQPIIDAFFKKKNEELNENQNHTDTPSKENPKEQAEASIRKMISDTDPMVIRHNEQKALNISTTMDEKEFQQTLAFRENLRKLL